MRAVPGADPSQIKAGLSPGAGPFDADVQIRGGRIVERRTILPAILAVSCGVLVGWLSAAARLPRLAADDKKTAETSNDPPRDVLPIPEPRLSPITTLDARNAKAPAR